MTKAIMRVVLGVFYAFAGVMHLAYPDPFLTIMPPPVPFAEEVVWWTGVAEIVGALALLQPFHRKLRQAAGIGLALYSLCVWPANINHMLMDLARPDQGLGLAYHIPRMIAQPVTIWLALWVGEVSLRRRS